MLFWGDGTTTPLSETSEESLTFVLLDSCGLVVIFCGHMLLESHQVILLHITGGLHLLRGTSLCRCHPAHDHWDCDGRRPRLPIREDSFLAFCSSA